jgi:hypothetical protein
VNQYAAVTVRPTSHGMDAAEDREDERERRQRLGKPLRWTTPDCGANSERREIEDQASSPRPLGYPRAPPPEEPKNPVAVALGRLGGLKGGKARAKKLLSVNAMPIGRRQKPNGAREIRSRSVYKFLKPSYLHVTCHPSLLRVEEQRPRPARGSTDCRDNGVFSHEGLLKTEFLPSEIAPSGAIFF